ncbi:hypothetical protein M407DRAFT_198791 [Tulasnella calospora MUT 4182]|uniref:Uncharacterized protein n=1 Tax=Tulasnella calospora MUT 4182 TaxID=1051891 RepID=A0A0C3QUY5_9AGAM|nr:hypothetical protein M407DRAFT_198791 [Tulasnella calospora MUT 4182]
MFTLNCRSSIRRKFNAPNDWDFFNTGYELSNVLGSDRQARQTESRRTTIVFAESGPAFTPNASMRIVNERVEGGEGLELYGGRSKDDDGLTRPVAGHKEPQVDLDRWENEVRPGSPDSGSAPICSQRTPEPPPRTTPSEGV